MLDHGMEDAAARVDAVYHLTQCSVGSGKASK